MTRSTTPSGRRIAFTLILTLALALSSGVLASCSSGASNSQQPAESKSQESTGGGASTVAKKGSAAPDFEFEMIDGTTAKLSDYKGQVVLLNFWATWCGYCIREMPDMAKITETYPDVVVLAINRGDQPAKAISGAEELGYDFVWGLDRDGAIEALYPANGIPYSVIIDKDGVVTTTFSGSAADMYPRFEQAVVEAGA
ncbi:MAG: TlpA disulfide reductase family protein [Raoultibacter sp.]